MIRWGLSRVKFEHSYWTPSRPPLFGQKISRFRFYGVREMVWQLEVKVEFNKEVYLSDERLERLLARGQKQSVAQAAG